MNQEPPQVAEAAAEEAGDAFGSLATSRPGPASDAAVIRPAKAPEAAQAPVSKQERLKALIPETHREDFAHSATWWQNNIEIFKHRATGRYLYLSKEASDETNVHAYQYTANGHRFVEIPMEAAIEFAITGVKVGEKKAGFS